MNVKEDKLVVVIHFAGFNEYAMISEDVVTHEPNSTVYIVASETRTIHIYDLVCGYAGT